MPKEKQKNHFYKQEQTKKDQTNEQFIIKIKKTSIFFQKRFTFLEGKIFN